MGDGGNVASGMLVASGVVRFWGFGWEAILGVRWRSREPGAWVRVAWGSLG